MLIIFVAAFFLGGILGVFCGALMHEARLNDEAEERDE